MSKNQFCFSAVYHNWARKDYTSEKLNVGRGYIYIINSSMYAVFNIGDFDT